MVGSSRPRCPMCDDGPKSIISRTAAFREGRLLAEQRAVPVRNYCHSAAILPHRRHISDNHRLQQRSCSWIPPRRPNGVQYRGTGASCSARSCPFQKAMILDIVDFGPSSQTGHPGLDDPTTEELSTQNGQNFRNRAGEVCGSHTGSLPHGVPDQVQYTATLLTPS